MTVGNLGAVGGSDKARCGVITLLPRPVRTRRGNSHALRHARHRDAIHLDLEAGAHTQQAVCLEQAQSEQVEPARRGQLARPHGARKARSIVLSRNGFDVRDVNDARRRSFCRRRISVVRAADPAARRLADAARGARLARGDDESRRRTRHRSRAHVERQEPAHADRIVDDAAHGRGAQLACDTAGAGLFGAHGAKAFEDDRAVGGLVRNGLVEPQANILQVRLIGRRDHRAIAAADQAARIIVGRLHRICTRHRCAENLGLLHAHEGQEVLTGFGIAGEQSGQKAVHARQQVAVSVLGSTQVRRPAHGCDSGEAARKRLDRADVVLFLFMPRGAHRHDARHRRIDRVAVRHRAREATGVACRLDGHIGRKLAAKRRALGLGHAHQLDAHLFERALHDVVAHKAGKAASVQAPPH